MTLQELISKRDKVFNELTILETRIQNHKDGYKHKIVSMVYCINSVQNYNNFESAIKDAECFNGDNGLAHVITNNKNVDLKDIILYGGCVWYHPNPDEITHYDQVEEICELLEKVNNEEDTTEDAIEKIAYKWWKDLEEKDIMYNDCMCIVLSQRHYNVFPEDLGIPQIIGIYKAEKRKTS